MSRNIDEAELQGRLDSLPRELPPGQDAWSRILARIAPGTSAVEPPAAQPRYRRQFFAAALLLVFASGLFFGRFLPDSSFQVPAAPDTGRVEFAPLATSRWASEQEYQAAFRAFLALEAHPGAGPESEAFGQGWSTLQRAESDLLAALEDDPEDALLTARLRDVRAHQIGMLRQLITATTLPRSTLI